MNIPKLAAFFFGVSAGMFFSLAIDCADPDNFRETAKSYCSQKCGPDAKPYPAGSKDGKPVCECVARITK